MNPIRVAEVIQQPELGSHLRIRPLSPGMAHGISVNTDAELRGLNGNYLVELSLSKNEVARMFALCFQDDPLSEVVEVLGRGVESRIAAEN